MHWKSSRLLPGVTTLFLLLALSLTQNAVAQNNSDSDRGDVEDVGQSIEGTWISQLTDASGNVNLFEVGTYAPGGSYTGANVNGLHSTHKGVWQRIGHRKFALTVLFFTHDAQGTFNGIVRARILVTLAEDLNSYDSVAERTVMDTLGNVKSVTPGIKGHSVRMELLPPPE